MTNWIPAYAGMTSLLVLHTVFIYVKLNKGGVVELNFQLRRNFSIRKVSFAVLHECLLPGGLNKACSAASLISFWLMGVEAV